MNRCTSVPGSVRRGGVWRRWAVVALGLSAAVLGSAVLSVDAEAQADAESPPPTALEQEHLQVGGIAFSACELGRFPQVLRAYCAGVAVPENPQADTQTAPPAAAQADSPAAVGRKIMLRVAWIPAARRQAAADVLLYLAGGPGQAATEVWPQLDAALSRWHRDRAVLLVDQRGTGGSNRLDCPSGDDDFAAAADSDAAAAEQVRRCLSVVAAHADPRAYTTRAYLRDLETLRAQLHIAQFDLVGGSYGTRVALDYLRLYPQAVRSVVLDGVLPPTLAAPDVLSGNIDEVLARTFADCVADADCHTRYGDPAATLRRLRADLRAHPRLVDFRDAHTDAPRSEHFSEAVLVNFLRFFAYQDRTRALLPWLLDEAARGHAEPLLALAQSLGRTLQADLATGQALSVVCSEDVPFLQAHAPLPESLLGDDIQARFRAQCAEWPHERVAADFKTAVRSDKPVLLLSGEYDPVTPPRYAEDVAATLPNSRSLVLRGQGHIQLATGCVPKLVLQFFDTLQAQAVDARCLDVIAAAPAFVSAQGPSP